MFLSVCLEFVLVEKLTGEKQALADEWTTKFSNMEEKVVNRMIFIIIELF